MRHLGRSSESDSPAAGDGRATSHGMAGVHEERTTLIPSQSSDRLANEARGGSAGDAGGGLLEARDLSLTLGTTRALVDVSFGVEAGEIVSVMGPSGSGKSTLLHCLAGILRPDAGQVWLDGRRLDTLSERQRSEIRLREMGFVFQFGDLIPELSLVENVALPLQLLGTRRADAHERALDVMGRLGIADVADGTVATASGGQAQRAAVARAVVHRPKVLFADEPTGSLDSISGEQVMNALVDVAESAGTAVVLVTHDARVAAYAHRNVTVRDGRTSGATMVAR